MELPVELTTLAQELSSQGYPLYIVGGYVRDYLLGIPNHDIDICGNIPLEKIIEAAIKLGFSYTIIQRELGTLQLKKDSFLAEYTRFRCELYEKGEHRPVEVEWVNDLIIDAKRRDFTINSIYYDITNQKIIDPCHGQEDLDNRIIRTVEDPKITLSRDGLRILRVLRFSQELHFGIDIKTQKACMEYKHLLRDISKERITTELMKIFFAYQKNNQSSSPSFIVRLMNEWKIWKEMIPTLSFEKICLNYHQMFFWLKDQNITAYQFYKNVYLHIPAELGYMGLLILLVISDIGERITKENIPYSVMKVLGNDGLKETKHCQRSIEKILYCMIRRQDFETKLSYRQFVIAYHEYSHKEKTLLHCMDPAYYDRVEQEYDHLIQQKIPTTLSELDITAAEILQSGFPQKEIGKVMQWIHSEILLDMIPNKKANILEKLHYLIEKQNYLSTK